MQALERNGYSSQEVMDILHAKETPRNIRFRYDLLDKTDKKKMELSNVLSGEVSLSSLAQIKRTARFEVQDNGEIDFLSDRIQPFVMFEVPAPLVVRWYDDTAIDENASWDENITLLGQPSVNGSIVIDTLFGDYINKKPQDFIEFPLGVFLLSSPTRREENGIVFRNIEAFDGLLVLAEDRIDAKMTFVAGTSYYQAVVSLLQGAGVTKYNIENSDKIILRDLEYEIGTDKLAIVNDLLSQINFTPMVVDAEGFYTARKYISPSIRTAEYMYATDDVSVVYNGMEETLDLFKIPNKWVAVVSNPEQTPLRSVYTNTNVDSPTSTANRGRTITDFRTIDNMADQSSLDAYVQRIAEESSQVFGHVRFETAIMPIHDYADVYEIDSDQVKGKFSEVNWTILLKAGTKMKHECRKTVNI